MMRPLLPLLTVAALLIGNRLPLSAQTAGPEGSGWNVMIGLSAARSAKYPGSEEYDSGLAPFGTIDYKGIVGLGGSRCVNGYGLYVKPIQTERFSLGMLAVRADTRKERDAKALAGMGNRRSVSFVGLESTFDLRVCKTALEVMKGGRDEAGWATALEVSRSFPLGERTELALSAVGIWGDKDFLAWEFGISKEQAASRQRLIDAGNTYLKAEDARPFSPKSGVCQGKASISLQWQLSQHWLSSASVEYGRILGDAAHSPLTRRTDQTGSSLTLLYRF